MIEVKIPKEVRSDTRFISMFTFRQCVCIACVAPICYFIYTHFKDKYSIDMLMAMCGIPGVIAWAFGWLNIYGMKLEQFIGTAFVLTVLAPTKRKYMTDNVFSYIERDVLKNLKETEIDEGKGKRRKKKKEKYIKSKKAIF